MGRGETGGGGPDFALLFQHRSPPARIGAVNQKNLVHAVTVQIEHPGIAGQSRLDQAGRHRAGRVPVLPQHRYGQPRARRVQDDVGADFCRGGNIAAQVRRQHHGRIARHLWRRVLRHVDQGALAETHAALAQVIKIEGGQIHRAALQPRGLRILRDPQWIGQRAGQRQAGRDQHQRHDAVDGLDTLHPGAAAHRDQSGAAIEQAI